MKQHRIEHISYSAPTNYYLDIEIIAVSDLKNRASQKRLSSPHRVNFNHLLVITEESCTHTVDFQPIACPVSTWLLIKAGQVHAFDVLNDWQGWLIVFKPETLPQISHLKLPMSENDIFDSLPTVLNLPRAEHLSALNTIEQMKHDANQYGHSTEGNLLIRAGLYYLLMRLHILAHQVTNPDSDINPLINERFKRFKQLVENQLHTHHHVHDYAKYLGCSEKSLNRCVQTICGISAKHYLMQKIVLHAKRQLVHTDQAIGAIGLELGFNEPTNFVKFFKREAGISPLAFRQHYLK